MKEKGSRVHIECLYVALLLFAGAGDVTEVYLSLCTYRVYSESQPGHPS